MADESLLPPPPTPPEPPAPSGDPLAGLQTATQEGMARDLADAAPKATAAAAAPAPAPVDDRWAALRDVHGNPFSPELHLTNQEGIPALSRAGRLMARPGMGPTCKARAKGLKPKASAPAAPAKGKPTALHLDDEPDPDEEDEEGEGVDLDAPAPLSRDEIEQRAQMDAETVADTEGILLDMLMPGELTAEERSRLERTARRVMLQDGIELPFGAKALHSLELLRVFNRRAKTAEGQASLGRLGEFMRNLAQQLKGRAAK